MKLGWIGMGRMGAPMAARLVRAGYAVLVWNCTRAKAKSEELKGANVADSRSELADVDALFTMLSTGQDVIEVCFGTEGMFREGAKTFPRLLIDCSTISMAEFCRSARSPGQARRPISCRASQWQSEMRPCGEAVLRCLGTRGRLHRGQAGSSRHCAPRSCICRRRGTGADV